MSNTILRQLVSGTEAKDQLLAGLNKSCDIIASTIGYRGQNILFETIGGLPNITADGYDSLEQLYWEDAMDHIACEIVKEACRKQLDLVGDNTSLVCVLTQAFFQYSLDKLKEGESSIEIKKKIDESVLKILDYIDSIAVPVTDELMYDIAKTSAHGDEEIAKIVQEAFVLSGEHGIVSHKRSFTDETYIKHIAGNPVDSGYLNEGFVNVPETQSVVFDNPLVLCSLISFQTINEVLPFLEYASTQSRPLVLIANMTHDISNAILENVFKYKSPLSIIRPPYQGKKGRETMRDLALILHCEVLEGISRTNYDGKEKIYLGECERIESDKKDTVITLSKEAVDRIKISGKIADLSAQILLETTESEKNYIRERISKISGGISTIFVGGVTPSEVEEKVARVDDAISAVRASKDGGVVAGGGVALLGASSLDGLCSVTKESITAPIKKIFDNAGLKNYSLSSEDAKKNKGFDVKDYENVDMFEAGIIDTAKGIKTALVGSASASNNLLRTDNVVTLKRFAHDTK